MKNDLTPVQKASADIGGGASLKGLLASGVALDDVIAALRAQTEDANRSAQASIGYSGEQSADEWAARKAWLLDGQPIHGELKEFLWPAIAALNADDQAEFSRNRDLLFKALRTFLGDPPAPPDESIAVDVVPVGVKVG